MFRTQLEDIRDERMVKTTTTGPARTQMSSCGQSWDMVLTLSFDTQNILHDWLKRHQKHGWPSPSTLREISKMRGNLVPKGVNGSSTDELEWRLSFGEIELSILKDLNDTQLKLYKMLKFINKDILKTNGHTTSLYMMKNIVFWLAGQYPQSMFRSETLFSWIIKSLRVLKNSATAIYLPYYMIPARNLFTEKVIESRRKLLYQQLVVHMNNGPSILSQCEQVKQTVNMVPRDLKQLQDKLDEFENTFMCQTVHQLKTSTLASPAVSISKDVFLRKCNGIITRLLLTPWPPHIQAKLNECSTREGKIRFLLGFDNSDVQVMSK